MNKIMAEYTLISSKDWERDCMEMCPGVNLYSLPGVSIFIANRVMDFPAGLHSHNEYEFMMPLNDNVIAQCDNENILMEKQKITPFNSGQMHGVPVDTKIEKLICLTCEKDFLEKISLLGFGKAEISFENSSFEVSNNIRFILGMFVEESISKPSGYQVMQDNLVNILFTEIIRCSDNSVNINESVKTNQDKIGLNRAVDFLKEQYATSFSIEEVARVAGLSPSYFMHAFKNHMGKTPYSFYTEVKIEKAKELLQNREIGITEVALASGFSNSGHFSTVFKRKTGVTPTEYKKSIC